MTNARWLLPVSVLFALAFVVGIGELADRTPVTHDGPLVSDESRSPATVAEERQTAGVLVDRVQLFRTGNLGVRFRLTGAEMTALLRHAAPGMIPAGVTDPLVWVRGEEVYLQARVARHELLPPSDGFALPELLPDTVRVVLRGEIRTASAERIVYSILGARVGRIPVPRSVIATVVASLPGGSPETVLGSPGNEPQAPTISVRAPAGIGELSVVDEQVVFFRVEPFVDRAVDGSDP